MSLGELKGATLAIFIEYIQCSSEISEPKYTQKTRIRKTRKCIKKTWMRVNTYAKRLISIYELSLCLSFVAFSLFSLNRLRCGECENNLRVIWSVHKKSHHMLILMVQSPSGWIFVFQSQQKKKIHQVSFWRNINLATNFTQEPF